ncbi:MAG: 16S rRNA (cytosine(1402)-N(4))-methyltransferase RsmH [Acutalibacteraceae bacterium]|nr:16S rRNA (cytosine(1402)-N(4))-methyltransferase RsmH [Acutalibacteraceae bacterium]
MEFVHKSVLYDEVIESLNIRPNCIYVDGTAGGAGHSKGIAEKLDKGFLYALDRDPDAVATATKRLEGLPAKVIKTNFMYMDEVLNDEGISGVDGILLDLGVSSFQLDTAERGFSYHKEAPLDMRMSKDGTSASDIVNNYSVGELAEIFTKYGEEKFSYKIAQSIVRERETTPITTTTQLAEIIASSVPAFARRDGHPARKCFQALRIAVNGELESLEAAIGKAFDLLNKDGVLSIITFHSLEDRMVKLKFKEFCTGCTCPPDFPICVCGKTPRGELVNRKPITATQKELDENPRSRSATLRSIRKL